MPNGNRDKTIEAVQSQLRAMGAEVFEVGLFKPDAQGREPVMLPRVWDHDSLVGQSDGFVTKTATDETSTFAREASTTSAWLTI